LFGVLYGQRWQPAVLPFQLLCAGGILKLLNAYAAQANEAAGNIWPQVRRQAIGAILVVVGAAVGSVMGGVTGAALGVLAGMVVLTALMQSLVRHVTGLSWSGLLRPLAPAAAASALVAAAAWLADAGLRAAVADPAPLLRLTAQAAAAGLCYTAFVLFSPFETVRVIVAETLDDLLPARAQQVITWRPRPQSR
jgi:Polysaccharide biosynthesis C-terminal domain